MKIISKNMAISIGEEGQITKVKLKGHQLDLSGKMTAYVLDSEVATISDIRQSERTVHAVLKTTKCCGELTIRGGRKISIDIRGKEEGRLNKIGFVLFLPQEAEIHLPERYTVGRIIDKDMPIGEVYTYQKFAYQFIVIKLEENWLGLSCPLKLTSDVNLQEPYQGYPKVNVFRVEDGFYLQYEWCPQVPLYLDTFHSLEEAADDYHTWLKETFGLVKLKDNPYIPEWVENTKLIITFDMGRMRGNIAHDYQHATDLCNDLHSIGCPQDTLLYIVGWSSSFQYVPIETLGGKEKFRQMVDTAHRRGYRIMIHTLPWGADPYRPDFEKIKKFALKRDIIMRWPEKVRGPSPWFAGLCIEGDFLMWPGGWRQYEMDFIDSGKISIFTTMKEDNATFTTVHVPEECEARFTLGGISGEDARITVHINERCLSTPKGWFKENTSYTFPFTFFFFKGVNEVKIELSGKPITSLRISWYRIYEARGFSPNWSVDPIVRMDISNPEWINLYTRKISQVVKEYNIDAVQLDAVAMWEKKGIYAQLRDQMPRIAFSTESCTELGLGYSSFSQNDFSQGDLSQDTSLYVEKRSNWQKKYTDLPYFITKGYTRFYPHLRTPQGFVPTRNNLQVLPKEVLAQFLENSERFHIIRNIRVNYKDYGLDPGAKEMIGSLVH